MPDVATLATVASAPSAPPSGTPPVASPQQSAKPAAAKPAAPDPRAWAEMSPDQRAAHQRAELDRQAGRGPEHLHTRDSNNRPMIDGKYADGTSPQADPNSPPAPDAAAAAEKFKVGSKFEVTEAELEQMLQRQSAEDLKRATLPAAPEAYKAELPADRKLPAGIEYKFNNDDPSLIAARNWAHANGMSQDQFSQVLGIYASHVAGQEAKLAEIARAEIAKVGPNAPQRVDAIGRWIRSEIGDADAKPILASLCTDAHLRFYERMQAKIMNQGAASFSQKHRDVEPRGVDDATWNSWSYSQKKAYSEAATARQSKGR
jgi:hypothetical protein